MHMASNDRTFSIWLVLTVGALFFTASQATAAGSCDWRSHFEHSDFKNPEIKKLLQQYKRTSPPDEQLATKLAAFGKSVVPFMDQISCKRKHHFYFLDPKGGWFGIYADTPYIAHATRVLERIDDPAAVPFLKKMMFDRDGGAAQDALIRLNAPFSKDEIEAIIKADSKSYVVSYRLSKYSAMARGLNSKDEAEVSDLIKRAQ